MGSSLRQWLRRSPPDVVYTPIDVTSAWAIKVTNWINTKYPDANVQLLTNVSGQLGQLHWLSTTETLGEYEPLMARIAGDDEYVAMLKDAQAEQLFAEGGARQSFYRTLEG